MTISAVAMPESVITSVSEPSSKSHDYRKDDARTIVFPVSIAADAEAVVRYTVQYSW